MFSALRGPYIRTIISVCVRMCVHTTIQKEENSYKTWAHTHSNYYDYLSMLGKVE